MKLSDLIPYFYKKNVEIQHIINTEELELENNLKIEIDNNFKNTFALEANEKGIENFENLFSIKPNIFTESLEFRRERIMNRLVSSIPYTEKYLIAKLNALLGEGNWNYSINYNSYTLKIVSLIPGKSWYRELINFMDETIPCNIDWKVEVYSATWGLVYDHFNTWNKIQNMTWQQLQDAQWSK